MMDIEGLNSKAKKISNDLRELGTKKEKKFKEKNLLFLDSQDYPD